MLVYTSKFLILVFPTSIPFPDSNQDLTNRRFVDIVVVLNEKESLAFEAFLKF